MLSPTDSVPVKIQLNTEDYMQGHLYEASGLVKLRDKALVLEYQTSGMDMVKSEVYVFAIPLRDVRSVDYKKVLFSVKVAISVNSLSLLGEMPGGEGDTLKLRVPWKARGQAEDFVSFIRAELSEMKFGGS